MALWSRPISCWPTAPGTYPPSGNDANGCQAPATPCATINGALNKPGFVAGDTILVATGVYTGTGTEVVLLNKNATLSGGWNAAFTTQSGASTIDGQGARRGMTVDFGRTAVVERFTVQNGNGGSSGGGIRNRGTLTLNNSTVSGNAVSSGESYGAGGGIYNDGAATLNNCTVSGNTNDMYGGGIYQRSGHPDPERQHCQRQQRQLWRRHLWWRHRDCAEQHRPRQYAPGGGIYKPGGTATLNNSAISGNRLTPGGGIYNSDRHRDREQQRRQRQHSSRCWRRHLLMKAAGMQAP